MLSPSDIIFDIITRIRYYRYRCGVNDSSEHPKPSMLAITVPPSISTKDLALNTVKRFVYLFKIRIVPAQESKSLLEYCRHVIIYYHSTPMNSKIWPRHTIHVREANFGSRSMQRYLYKFI